MLLPHAFYAYSRTSSQHSISLGLPILRYLTASASAPDRRRALQTNWNATSLVSRLTGEQVVWMTSRFASSLFATRCSAAVNRFPYYRWMEDRRWCINHVHNAIKGTG